MKKISKLQYITHSHSSKSNYQICREFLEAGGRWVQLRMKNVDETEFLDNALELRELTEQYESILIINDNVDIALKSNADGIHLGKSDLPINEARKILGNQKIIGGTANTLEDCIGLYNSGVDYIGLGPFRFTETKKNLSPVLGFTGYQEIQRKLNELAIKIPVIAIGGIVVDDTSHLINTHIYGIAVSSSITNSSNINLTTKEFLKQL